MLYVRYVRMQYVQQQYAVYAINSQVTPISSKGTRMFSQPIVGECIMRMLIELSLRICPRPHLQSHTVL